MGEGEREKDGYVQDCHNTQPIKYMPTLSTLCNIITEGTFSRSVGREGGRDIQSIEVKIKFPFRIRRTLVVISVA